MLKGLIEGDRNYFWLDFEIMCVFGAVIGCYYVKDNYFLFFFDFYIGCWKGCKYYEKGEGL